MERMTTLLVLLWMVAAFAAYYSLKALEIICFEITGSCLG